jgi:uncharacterized flavoprotein (TIGR03862 family)
MMKPYKIAIVGTGPAALMAADRLATAGHFIHMFEKRPGAAWKLFVAGSSGLNITNSSDHESFASQYTGPKTHWDECLKSFSNLDWVRFIENELGQKTFLGTSGRYFVENMHAALLVKAWKKRLESKGVSFHLGHELSDFNATLELSFANGFHEKFDRVLLALGGGSYEPNEIPLRWVSLLQSKGLQLIPFTPVNTGYHVAWKAEFLREVDGEPFKNIVFLNAKGSRKGDLVITEYGLEGTPVYTLGEVGPAQLDLKPDLSHELIRKKLLNAKENLALLRRAQKYLHLNKAAMALLFHHGKPGWKTDMSAFIDAIKAFPIELLTPRPLSESISARGGVSWEELDSSLQLKRFPGIWLAGEMIDWEAPTGGFLIQGAVSEGAFAADSIMGSMG